VTARISSTCGIGVYVYPRIYAERSIVQQ